MAMRAEAPEFIPGGAVPVVQQTVVANFGFAAGQKVLTLRSDGTWSEGVITEVSHDKVTVALRSGTKQIRKELASQLLRRPEQDDSTQVKDLHRAYRKAAAKAWNARVAHDKVLMRMKESAAAACSTPETTPKSSGKKKKVSFGEVSFSDDDVSSSASTCEPLSEDDSVVA
jgi:hypothetical protein